MKASDIIKSEKLTGLKHPITKELERIQIYGIPFHETGSVKINNENFKYTRVPGGWIYRIYDKDNVFITSQFVPYNEEFKLSDDEIKAFNKKARGLSEID